MQMVWSWTLAWQVSGIASFVINVLVESLRWILTNVCGSKVVISNRLRLPTVVSLHSWKCLAVPVSGLEKADVILKMAVLRSFMVPIVETLAISAAIREGGVWLVLLAQRGQSDLFQCLCSRLWWLRVILARQGRGTVVLNCHKAVLLTIPSHPLVRSSGELGPLTF